MLLVTGASGLLGASVLLHARGLGREVVGICHRHPLRIPDVKMSAVDLTNRSATREIIMDARPGGIVHCAAATNVDWCEDHPAEAARINVETSAFLAELAQELNARMIYVSTDSVFEGNQGNYSETDEPAPVNIYAQSKLRGEDEVFRHMPGALVVRTNIYGWNAQDKQSLAEWILSQLETGQQVRGFSDIYFCPMLANDLADLLLMMLDRGLSGLYHVVGEQRISKYEFARRVAATFQFDPEQVKATRSEEAKLRAPRPLDISLSTEKIRLALGREMPAVEAGLQRFRGLRELRYPQQLKGYLDGAGA
jgi:dTDP-4-dehydrorhamnose reductase